jgi:hypothetical protein
MVGERLPSRRVVVGSKYRAQPTAKQRGLGGEAGYRNPFRILNWVNLPEKCGRRFAT